MGPFPAAAVGGLITDSDVWHMGLRVGRRPNPSRSPPESESVAGAGAMSGTWDGGRAGGESESRRRLVPAMQHAIMRKRCKSGGVESDGSCLDSDGRVGRGAASRAHNAVTQGRPRGSRTSQRRGRGAPGGLVSVQVWTGRALQMDSDRRIRSPVPDSTGPVLESIRTGVFVIN